MKKIKMDTDVLNETIRSYENFINDLRKYKTNINSSIRELDRGWSGKAKDAFYNISRVDWDKTIDDSIEKLTNFTDSLKKVKTAYENIENEAIKLKNNV